MVRQLFFAFFFVLVLQACTGDEPAPCSAAETNGASIFINQELPGTEQVYKVDTVLIESFRGQYLTESIRFTARNAVGPFSWQVGDDSKTFTDSSFVLDFSSPAGVVQVQLEAAETLNDCGSGQEALLDTAALTLLPASEYSYGFEGVFKGTSSDQPDTTIEVTIRNLGEAPQGDSENWYGLRIHNLPVGCGGPQLAPETFTPGVDGRLYRQFHFNETNSSAGCPEIEGTGIIDGDHLIIEYRYRKTGTNQYVIGTFDGRRIAG